MTDSKKNECHCNSYISASDTNTTLKKTFEFIKNNQVDESGYLINTSIITSLTLLDNQGTLIDTPRETAETFISGIIGEVGDNYVVLLVSFKCEDGSTEYIEYIIQYDTIINLFNNVLVQYLDEYLCAMNQISISKNYCNRNYVLLEELKRTIKVNKFNPNATLSIIYDGVSSLDYYAKDIIIVKNLILIKRVYGIIPITQVGGFFWRNVEC